MKFHRFTHYCFRFVENEWNVSNDKKKARKEKKRDRLKYIYDQIYNEIYTY